MQRKRSVRVLVVEDNPDILAIVAEHLIREGYDVGVASDGRAAMRMIRERAPAVVCLDLNLPCISGYEVCEQIRLDPALRDISILMTSARDTLDIRIGSLEAGADAYLVKPFALVELSEEIAKLVEQRTTTASPSAMRSESIG